MDDENQKSNVNMRCPDYIKQVIWTWDFLQGNLSASVIVWKITWVYLFFWQMGFQLSCKSQRYWYDPQLKPHPYKAISSVQFSSVTQSSPTLWDPMNRSTPGLPVHHQLPEFTQTQCPSSRWCHPAISSSVVPFPSCPQSLPTSECFPMSQLFARGGQSIGVSASTSALPMNTQDWFPLGWTGWISLQSKGLSRVFSKHCAKPFIGIISFNL